MGYSPGEMIFIHPSRVVRLIGHEYPDMESAPDAWGDSVLQPVADALRDAGLVTSSVASMIAEAKVDIVHIPGLLNIAMERNPRLRYPSRAAQNSYRLFYCRRCD